MTDHLRVSDAERRQVAELLSRHFTDGRLDREELEDRIGAAIGATTRRDLAPLLADLPPLAVTPAPARRPKRGARRLAVAALAFSLLVPASLLARVHESQDVQGFHRPPSAVLLPFVRSRAPAQLALSPSSARPGRTSIRSPSTSR